ncbi:flavin reductase family protein [Halorubellus sp. JP-L1]|uniref:flavin reductase family protein n=1 Tax=Halorubellus sp. JP-L1 TaxID=2715753 RepID=UPI00140AD616|nr:flavin reductase family protein [Halorubellus sp. JP-L1]NHN42812.1 flavin reductase family protein [Halorubellus sp. JP-L1]
MDIDLSVADESSIHRTLTTIVAPRPIGWISSKSADGEENLAPFSYFNAISTHPPMVMFSPVDRDGGELKDTPANVLETGEFVVNMVTEDQLEAMDLTGETVEPNVDEFEFAGIEKEPAETVDVSRVADAQAVLECSFHDDVSVPGSTLVLGIVDYISVDDDVCVNGKIDSREIDSVGRMGGPYYTGVNFLPYERGDAGKRQ